MQRLKQDREWWGSHDSYNLQHTNLYTRRTEPAVTSTLSFGGNDWTQNRIVNILLKRPLTHSAQRNKYLNIASTLTLDISFRTLSRL